MLRYEVLVDSDAGPREPRFVLYEYGVEISRHPSLAAAYDAALKRALKRERDGHHE